MGLLREQHCCLPIVRFRHHLEAAGLREQGTDALAHDGMVVDDQHTNTRFYGASAFVGHSVTSTFTRVPAPGLLSYVSSPPMRAVRSAMVRKPPRPSAGTACGSNPTPSSDHFEGDGRGGEVEVHGSHAGPLHASRTLDDPVGRGTPVGLRDRQRANL